jgi:protoporphyrin/coproporphyrin ferrochelatase
MRRVGVLLVNLGTPSSFHLKDVFHYLTEFLTDSRVIDLPWLKRQLLVRGVIIPLRVKQSAEQYRHLWIAEGAPLLVHGRAVQQALQQTLGVDYQVVLAMRYQSPSILKGLEELQRVRVNQIVVFPLFPQYASSTTGSVHQKVMEQVKKWTVIPKMTFISHYFDHPAFIEACCARAEPYLSEVYDHVLFSFHGLPERHIRKADPIGHCLSSHCCQRANSDSLSFCYKAQCYATARAIAERLAFPERSYTVCFQSRLGRDPWIQPYTTEMLRTCLSQGYKRLLVFCPSFVCDCLETTGEISREYGHEFQKLGGEILQLVEGLNHHPVWIQALSRLIKESVN